jgi:hypothetical protein
MALARTLALVSAVALVATPALAQAPKPAPAPAAKATTPAPPPISNAPPVANPDDWPKGAPKTEYEFTAWCYGVLRTHMELYNQVKPELIAISKRWHTEEEDEKSYADQLNAGKMYLTEFAKALEMTERASARPINAQGAAAIEQGRRMWSEFNTVDKTMQAYSWMNWELPEKCPKVATALENKSALMAPALKANLPTTAAPAPKSPAPVAAAPKADPVGSLIPAPKKP